MSRITLNDYYFEPHNKIGRGSSGVVYLGYHQQTRDKVAIKRVDITNLKEKMTKLWNEIYIMKEMDHPNVIKLYDVHLDIKNEYLYLIMEYCDGSDLSDYIDDYSIDLTQVHLYITQLRDGLKYLHSKKIVHRDLKPHNLLLKNGEIKIADFGLSASNNNGGLMQTMCGSPLYMSPEIIEHQKYTAKSDLWSIGIILYQLIYHTHPFQDCRNFAELTKRIKTEEITYPKKPQIDSLTFDLLQGLLTKNCHNRISWNDFFNHAWFRHKHDGEEQEGLEEMSMLFGDGNDSLNGSLNDSLNNSYSPRSLHNSLRNNNNNNNNNDNNRREDNLNLSQFVVENYDRKKLKMTNRNSSRSSYSSSQSSSNQSSHRGRSRMIPIHRPRSGIRREGISYDHRVQQYGVSAPNPSHHNDVNFSPSSLSFSSMGTSILHYISSSYDWIRSSIEY